MSIEAQHAETLKQLVAAFHNISWASVASCHFRGTSLHPLSIVIEVKWHPEVADVTPWGEASVGRSKAHMDTTAGSEAGAVEAVRRALIIRMSHANRRVSECLVALGTKG